MKKKIILFAFFVNLLAFSFGSNNVLSVKIVFYPIGVKNTSLIIYNNEDTSFSEYLDLKIRKSSKAFFYNPEKDRCEEGFYKIIVNNNGTVYVYEVDASNIIYDVKRDKYLKCNALFDIYAYIAKKQLNLSITKMKMTEK